MIRVADYIADFVHRQGVKDIFMLSGGGSIYLDDGVACNKNLRAICVRNEAAAPMMAEAYARLNQNLGVVYVTTGPGGTNAVSGLSEAWVDSAPIMIISGQVARKYTSYNNKSGKLRTFGTQEINIVEVVKSLTKYAEMVNEPESIRYHLEKAVHLARTGRPGPVWLDIPLDVQCAMVDETKMKGYQPETAGRTDEIGSQIDQVVAMLQNAKRPLIIAGQGVRISRSVEQFRKLVETLDVPVISSRLGQDILPYSHRNNLGHGGMKGMRFTSLIMKESDLIISIGSRLSVPFVGENLDAFSSQAKIVMVDIDQAELKKPAVKVDLPIQADAGLFIRELSAKADIGSAARKEWMKTCQGYKARYPLIDSGYERNPIDLYYFVSRLDALSGKNHVFVSDAGSSYYATGQALRFEQGQREITSGAFASMGLSVALGIGCCAADKKAQVLAVTGDGSIELNIQELKTVSCYKLDLKIFVINNGGYVSIRNTQDSVCDGRYIGSDQVGCDELLNFQKVADAFSLPYHLIEKYEDVDRKILEVIGQKGPALIEVVTDNKQKIITPIKQGK
ncbi:MAG: thiamine pyrophosphate-binding protein [Candidatus Margulisiibacteriota bacterium]